MTRRLLIRPGAIGDFVLSLPALEHLKAGYTEVWCAEQNVPLAGFADHAQSIVSAGLDRLGHLPAEDVLGRLASFDEIHSWYATTVPEFRARVQHLPFRFYTSLPPDANLHATAFYCGQVGAPDALPKLEAPRGVNEEFAIIHPFASNADKRWPFNYFETIAEALGNCRWCAGPEEPLADAIRIPNLFDLARWLATARLFIGNDSGITHIAAALNMPVVALFGPTNPSVWAPRGPLVRIIAKPQLASIPPTEVLRVIKTLI